MEIRQLPCSRRPLANTPQLNCQLNYSATASQPPLQNSTELIIKVKVKVTLRLTVSQSVSLGVEPHLRPMARYLLLCDSYGLVLVGSPL
jgi:hypothetical protein